MSDEETLAGFPGDVKPLSRHTRRVAELLRSKGAADRWRGQCRIAPEQHRCRCKRNDEWQKARDEYIVANPSQSPEPPAEREPSFGPLIPFLPSHELSVADCYCVLAVVHDAERKGPGRLMPFALDDEVARRWYEVLLSNVGALTESDWLTLEDCLLRVEADREAFTPNSEPAAPSTSARRRPKATINARMIEMLGKESAAAGWTVKQQ